MLALQNYSSVNPYKKLQWHTFLRTLGLSIALGLSPAVRGCEGFAGVASGIPRLTVIPRTLTLTGFTFGLLSITVPVFHKFVTLFYDVVCRCAKFDHYGSGYMNVPYLTPCDTIG